MPQHLSDKEIVEMLSSENEKSRRVALLFMEVQWKPIAYDIVVRQGNGSRKQADGIYDEAVADLVLQVRRGDYFSEQSKLSTFFYGILRNKWLKFSRDVLSRHRREKEALKNRFLLPEKSAEERLIEKERVKAIADAIDRLDKDCRKLILDFWFKGKNLREIAGQLKASESAVKKRHERCKEKLRVILKRFLE